MVPLIYFLIGWINRKTNYLGQRKKDLDPLILKYYYESISGFIDIIVTGSQKFFRKRIKNVIKSQIYIDLRLAMMNELPYRALEVCLLMAVSVIIIYGVFIDMKNSQLITLIGVIGVSAYRLSPTINRISINLKTLASTSWTNEIVFEHMKTNQSTSKIKRVDYNNLITLKKYLV